MQRNGFTLIELSIVLVIIGLIVGGVLVGRDLIEASKLRAQAKQVEETITAFHTFRTKYGGMPGDLRASEAAALGMQARSGAAGHGDGNGRLEFCTPGTAYIGCENVLIWRDLSDAQLVKGGFGTATDAIAVIATGQADMYFPFTPMGNRNSLIAYHHETPIAYMARGAYLVLTVLQSTSAAGAPTVVPGMSRRQAMIYDTKYDNGFAGTGVVRGFWSNDLAGSFNTLCSSNVAPYAYSILLPEGIACQLFIQVN